MMTAFFAVWLMSASSISAITTYDVREITEPVSAERIESHLRYLADDALAGRAPGTPGAELTARYLEQQLASYEIEPAFPGPSFRERVPLHESRPLLTSRLEIRVFGEPTELKLGKDYLLHSWGPASSIPRPTPLIFVGHGIVAPELDHNDYFGVDVEGAVVVYLAGEPEFFSGDETTVYASLETKRRIAQSRGAVASIVLPKVHGDLHSGWKRLRTTYSFPGLELPQALPAHPSIIVNPSWIRRLFEDALYDLDQVRTMEATGTLRPFHLPVQMSFRGRFANRDFLAWNVGAVLRGRDPKLRDELIVVSAHYDHLGVSHDPISGIDRIFNGAVDNAIGVAGLLELARVMSDLPRAPRRSILFLFTTAEEAGTLGARHFLDRSPFRPSEIAANINIDGLAFVDMFSDVILVGGPLSSIQETFPAAIAPLGLEVGEAPPDLWIQDGFARSDQLAFAEAGVPAVMVNEGFSWIHHTREQAVSKSLQWLTTAYHTPADDLTQDFNFDATRLHVRAIASLLIALAEANMPPTWKPGTAYAYERALSRARGR